MIQLTRATATRRDRKVLKRDPVRSVMAEQSAYVEIFRQGIMSVRHYRPLAEASIRVGDMSIPVAATRHRVPLVLVPPLAATAIIFDLLPHRSVVRYFLACGFDVYLIDWGDVKASDRDLSLKTYVLEWMPQALAQVRKDSGADELSIFAYCMGGLLSLMYAAVYQDMSVRNIVTVASPVDMHASGLAGKVFSGLRRPARAVANVFNLSLLDIPARYFHVPGWIASLAFKLTDPVGNVASRLDMLLHMRDKEYLKERHTIGRWFNEMTDFPGETIKEMAVHMAINNRMAKGTLRIGDREASFKDIRASLLAFAGADDTLVSIEAARKALDIVSSEDRHFRIVSGGHAAVFAGKLAPMTTWKISAEWLSARSGPKKTIRQ